jgi:diguanylate cyclase (GGDEF)-like protein
MSLRLKIVLALLLSSLASVALVGGLAYQRLTHKVDHLRRQQSAAHFQASVAAYLERYGSWDAGNAALPFRQFMDQRQGRGGYGRPEGPPQGPLESARRGPPEGPPDGTRDGPPDDGPPPPGMGPPPPGQPDPGGEPPRSDGPPYRFILADGQYRVLLGGGVYRNGEPLPEEARQDALPVVVGGEVRAYVSPQGVLTPSKQELGYLAAMREALLYGVAAASALAVGLGLLLGSGLSGTLRRLTGAVQAMQGGALLQRVVVQGRDEVALLAQAFNQMSEELAKSHEELKASHQTILEQADRMKEMSIRDALTELYNRRHFDEQAAMLFQQSLRHGHPLTVVIGDIDFFKRINDQFSHATGDAVLRQIGAILRTHMRISDLVARYGGEEFVIALPETALPQAAALCDKLRDVIQNFPWQQVHAELKVTISMGLCADLAAGTVQAMLDKADTLLYRAKEGGRNQVCFA